MVSQEFNDSKNPAKDFRNWSIQTGIYAHNIDLQVLEGFVINTEDDKYGMAQTTYPISRKKFEQQRGKKVEEIVGNGRAHNRGEEECGDVQVLIDKVSARLSELNHGMSLEYCNYTAIEKEKAGLEKNLETLRKRRGELRQSLILTQQGVPQAFRQEPHVPVVEENG